MATLELTKEQLDIVQRFEADYNAVDKWLRKTLGSDGQASFTYLVKQYAEKHERWRDAEFLRTIADIRNTIVHGKTEPYQYLVIPAPFMAERLSRYRESLVNPVRVLPTFQRKVEVVSSDDKLSRVLRLINERDYSQFPVYENTQFRGLLTENGVTRWLARHVADSLSLIELDDISVSSVIEHEEVRKNFRFVRRDMLMDDLRALFGREALLEAAFVTQTGKQTEGLLGIATRWDMVHDRTSYGL